MKTPKITSLIVDNDPIIRKLLQNKITKFLPEVNESFMVSSGTEALQKIKTIQPDLIFLDIELDDMTGFEMLEQVNEINFQTIIIAPNKHFAIQAIRFKAFDFLVKPINLEELKQTIIRYRTFVKRINKSNQKTKAINTSKAMLVLQTQMGELHLKLRNIIRIEGERNYSYIFLKNQQKKLTTKTLGDLENLLNKKGFFRCHKSHLINFAHIHTYHTNNVVMLSDGSNIPIARRKKEEFKNWWESYQ